MLARDAKISEPLLQNRTSHPIVSQPIDSRKDTQAGQSDRQPQGHSRVTKSCASYQFRSEPYHQPGRRHCAKPSLRHRDALTTFLAPHLRPRGSHPFLTTEVVVHISPFRKESMTRHMQYFNIHIERRQRQRTHTKMLSLGHMQVATAAPSCIDVEPRTQASSTDHDHTHTPDTPQPLKTCVAEEASRSSTTVLRLDKAPQGQCGLSQRGQIKAQSMRPGS